MRSALALLLLTACSTSPSEEPAGTRLAPTKTREPVEAGAKPAHSASEELRKCAESKGDLASITDAVARLNALYPQANAPCFIATLPRPLAVVATLSVTSAQPAGGASSPRLFFLLPKLAISAVPDGKGSELLEFGEWVTPTRTIKGELEIPLTSRLASDAAFKHILQGDTRTVCGICHRDEERHPSIPDAFVSVAFRPSPGTLVTLSELEAFHDACARENSVTERCTMLHALFDFGEITAGEFAPEIETFF